MNNVIWQVKYAVGTINETDSMIWDDLDKYKHIESISLIENKMSGHRNIITISDYDAYIFMREASVSLAHGNSKVLATWIIGIHDDSVTTIRYGDELVTRCMSLDEFKQQFNLSLVRPIL